MTCAFGLPELVSHNPFLKDLEETGYLFDFVGGHLVFYGLPYLDKAKQLQHGDWASPLDVSAGGVIDPPQNHQAWWRGSRPCDQNGRELNLGGGPQPVAITTDFMTDWAFSYKLQDDAGALRSYLTFEEKIQTYFDTIIGPAMAAFPSASPLKGIATRAAAQDSPLQFPDTMSARYQINDLSALLRNKSVAIIGLGGTGSYLLDFLARTHLQRIALYDDDKVHIHTIFRFPGFIPDAIGKLKVEALWRQYNEWHAGIEPNAERITPENIDVLGGFDFVFVSVDDGPARRLIVEWLTAKGVPFVDCGMGLNRSKVGLSGFVRITGTDRQAFDENVGSVRLPTENVKEDEYRKQAQITELNALNATMAMIRFKQHFGMFDRESPATSHIFDSTTFEID